MRRVRPDHLKGVRFIWLQFAKLVLASAFLVTSLVEAIYRIVEYNRIYKAAPISIISPFIEAGMIVCIKLLYKFH